MAGTGISSFSNVSESLSDDVAKLVGLHLGRLVNQAKSEIGKATAAGTSFGGAAGMFALGTVLGSMGVVHMLHKMTGMPLWLCYGLCSATACAAGATFAASGAKAASELNIVPDRAREGFREATVGSGG